jgi:predicted acyltransferase
MNQASISSASVRLLSIDVLRGLTVAAMLLVNNPGDWGHVYTWLSHSHWHGCSPADFIFPFFLVIVGVSLHLAMEPQLARGKDKAAMLKSVVCRGVRIFALGVFLHLIAYALIEGRSFRLMGVLQRIAICYAVVGVLMMYVRSAKWQWIIFASILLFYWLLLSVGGSYEPHFNLVDKVDSVVLASLAYAFDPITQMAQEPEGILSTLPCIATVLLGVRIGAYLRAGQMYLILIIGVVCMALAWLWAFEMPLNKSLWTSSFVLWTGGLAALCIVLTHRLIDVRGFPAIGRSFGVNAIAAYAGSWIVACILISNKWDVAIYQHVFKQNLLGVVNEECISFLFALTFTVLFGVVMLVLRRRGWRFSI